MFGDLAVFPFFLFYFTLVREEFSSGLALGRSSELALWGTVSGVTRMFVHVFRLSGSS